VASHPQTGLSSPFKGLPDWSTANVECDTWLRTNILDQDVLNSFGEIPMRNRLTIVLKARASPKDNPVAWIAACVTNHRNRELQKRLQAQIYNAGGHPSTAQSASTYVSEASASHLPRGPTSPCSTHYGWQQSSLQITGPTIEATEVSDKHNADVMAWAAETWKSCASNKSKIIRAVEDVLTDETLQMFRDLSPEMQASFATVWIFACPARGLLGQEMMKGWLRRYRSLTGLAVLSHSSTAAVGMSSTTLTIQVIMIGCTAGYQYMILEAAFKLLSLRESRPYKLLPVLCCGADKYTDTVTSTMTNQQMCTPWVRTLSESELESRVGALVDQWHKDSVRLFIWTTLPMSAMNYVTEEDPEEVRHAVTTRYVSFSTELSARVMSVMGQTAVVDVFLAPFDVALNVKTVLESVFGPPMAHVGLQAIKDSCDEILLFCNLNLKNIEVVDVRLADRRSPIDGWRLCSEQKDSDSKAPLRIWSKLPELLCIRMFNDRVLTSLEQEMLRFASIEHETTKERRFVSRVFMERWLGIENTPYAAALQTICPCTTFIMPATGKRAELPGHGEACSKTRYCLGCEQFAAMMGALPSMQVVCPLVASVLGVGLRDWTSGSVEAWILRKLSGHALPADWNSDRIAQANH
jgi:hypothetical protein